MMENQKNDVSFNEWAKHTEFGILWAPTLDEIEFYQDHEVRKVYYEQTKHLPKIDFNEKTFMEVLVESISNILRLKK